MGIRFKGLMTATFAALAVGAEVAERRPQAEGRPSRRREARRPDASLATPGMASRT